jgi:lipopolysaccharide cholinephosphotransferase
MKDSTQQSEHAANGYNLAPDVEQALSQADITEKKSQYDIRTLQLRVLRILETFHTVCQQHHLTYYITSGTMLGAVRHGGFIPWDDDLDVAMPRADYGRLLSHAAEYLPQPFELVSAETDPTYPKAFAKIQDASTTLIERVYLQYLGGIYVDVFPLDGITPCPLLQRIHFARYSVCKRILYFMYRDPFKHGSGPSSWVPRLCQHLFTRSGIQHKLHRLQTAYDYDRCRYIVDSDSGREGIVPKDVFGTPTPILFEGVEVMGVEKPDAYLRLTYGDYMTLPKEENRRQHHFHYLNLEKPYRTQIQKSGKTEQQ